MDQLSLHCRLALIVDLDLSVRLPEPLSCLQQRILQLLRSARPEVSKATVAKQTKADDKTVAKVRRKLEATSEIPRLEKTTGRNGRSRPATTKGKSRAPSQKAGGIAGRTVTAEVDPGG